MSSLACAQIDLEDSHTTASLRGIDAVGAGVAWASGSDGTILRTEDGGYLWQTCTVPIGGEKLDFRGVQGFDAKTAVVMASGPGSLSKVYKTTDGCQSWKLVFEDPDGTGFFDSLRKATGRQMYLLGDPVGNRFAMFFSPDQGDHWKAANDPGREAAKDAGAFAASNTSLVAVGNMMMFGTSATPAKAAQVYRSVSKCPKGSASSSAACSLGWVQSPVPMGPGSTTVGVYSLGARVQVSTKGEPTIHAIAVGGNYEKPEESRQVAAWSVDGGEQWVAAKTMPAGYRSAVAYDATTQSWIAVGPTGMDESLDDGMNWTKVQPVAGQAAKLDEGWNAISLPFVVGSHGRIGKLREGALGRTK